MPELVPHSQPNPPANIDADAALMLRYARGDVAAFEHLYNTHEMGVYRFILRSVRLPQVADDLLQETWLTVVRQAASYSASAKFTTWLYTLARSRVIDWVRANKQADTLTDSIDDDTNDSAALHQHIAADERQEPLRQLQNRELARELLSAIEALPFEQREAYLLQAEGDMSVEDIAAATGVNVETAKSRLRYARGKLRQNLAHLMTHSNLEAAL
jgi:RNA polymerase sigma factor (sigma-70 family)